MIYSQIAITQYGYNEFSYDARVIILSYAFHFISINIQQKRLNLRLWKASEKQNRLRVARVVWIKH